MDFLKKGSGAAAWILMALGTGIMALGIKCVYDPIGMVTGGFSGLAIVIKDLTAAAGHGNGIPLSVTSLLLNIPVFIAAFRVKGKQFAGRSFAAMLMLSAWLAVWPQWDLAGGDYVIASIFGGGLSGVGLGLVLTARATTGGTDMVAAILHTKLRQYSVIHIMQIMDAVIVLAGLYVFGLKSALYAIIAVIVAARLSDVILEGMQISRAVYVISDRTDEISQQILRLMDRGVTGLDARGMYTDRERCVLLCVVSQKEIVQLKDIVMSVDASAFLIICDAREVWGEGFQTYSGKM